MNCIENLFWLSLAIVAYSYLGYGLLIWLLNKVMPKKSIQFEESFEPAVALVVPCFNEAAYIETKILNSLALRYPKEKLELIFVSDGSSDETSEIIKKYPQVMALHEPARKGKAAAMNRAMQYVKSEIVVFCDANTNLNPEAIQEMVKHYQFKNVGAVTGEKQIAVRNKENASAAGEGIYWKYESFLKQMDSDFYSIVGAAGELMSYRTALYKPLPEDTLLDDLMQSMNVALAGYRVVYEKKALAVETASANVHEELKRKVRIAAGAWQSMFRLKSAFNPFHEPKVFFLFLSHRVSRWTFAPLSLLVVLVSNIILCAQGKGVLFDVLMLLQVLFYAFALLGWYLENKQIKIKVLFVPYYFFIMNLCMYLGFVKYIRGKQSANWERAKRA